MTDSCSPAISEMREFANFKPREQRFIKLSLDIALCREPDKLFARWSRTKKESEKIIERQEAYKDLASLKAIIPRKFEFGDIVNLMGPLIELSAYDLELDQLETFGAYRFLYERLFGAKIRPWLPSSFCGASALPNVKPNLRKKLLQSISEAAATAPGWSSDEPTLFPEWIDKEFTD